MRHSALRRGFATMLALFVMILLGGLAAGIAFSLNEETRASRAPLRIAHADAAAEAAAWSTLGNYDWDTALSAAVGQAARSTYSAREGNATVTVTRVDIDCFSVVAISSEAQNATDAGRVERRVGLTVQVRTDSTGRARATLLSDRGWLELF